jgi:hypothetical protein
MTTSTVSRGDHHVTVYIAESDYLSRRLLAHVAGPQQGAVPLPPQVCAQVSSSIHAVRHPATTALIIPALEDFEPENKVALPQELGKPVLMAG